MQYMMYACYLAESATIKRYLSVPIYGYRDILSPSFVPPLESMTSVFQRICTAALSVIYNGKGPSRSGYHSKKREIFTHPVLDHPVGPSILPYGLLLLSSGGIFLQQQRERNCFHFSFSSPCNSLISCIFNRGINK
ncbi:hypothetical protein LOAG_07550 [Loa loa]|uniref:Uncharacterized protein n=1 Tax=Loa loa TaxID=7209 RepID=A0A1S0TW14_LOALO|nr:hypothetical protein LOAG_07550 [Loa loa]EFO20939.1 hypothetical protein LOAG_07550 [Loa loa]